MCKLLSSWDCRLSTLKTKVSNYPCGFGKIWTWLKNVRTTSVGAFSSYGHNLLWIWLGSLQICIRFDSKSLFTWHIIAYSYCVCLIMNLMYEKDKMKWLVSSSSFFHVVCYTCMLCHCHWSCVICNSLFVHTNVFFHTPILWVDKCWFAILAFSFCCQHLSVFLLNVFALFIVTALLLAFSICRSVLHLWTLLHTFGCCS